MDLTFSPNESAFREELRLWFSQNGPGEEPDRIDEEAHFEYRRRWQRQLADGRWAGVHWPVEHGGRGATLTESAIFFEELGRSGAPLPANALGLLLAGPTIMTWGDESHKERYLGPILTADEIWCQGFSEPAAGSDLAAVKTRAIHDGDIWRVSGQKVWTSSAQFSSWCMLLARTDADAPKHKGLTYFLLDMDTPGIEVKPLRQITGESEFNELFLDDVVIPDAQVLGGVGNGWRVALTTLMNERAGLAFFLQVRLRQLLDALVEALRERDLLDDEGVRGRLAELHVRAELLRLTAYRGLSAAERHGEPGPEGSVTKWLWSETNQLLVQAAVDLLGPAALDASSPWAYELLRARGNSIEGGTTEILKTVVAERVLGLPRGR